MISGVYKITSPTGRIYVGQTSNFGKRVTSYRLLHCKRQPKLYASIKKYGWTAHIFEVLAFSESVDEKNQLEKQYIDLFDCVKLGLNLMEGGGASGKRSIETRKKMSERQMGSKNHNFGKKMSLETRRKLVELQELRRSIEGYFANRGLHGEANGMYGRKHSEATRMSISQKRKGKPNNSIIKPIIQYDSNGFILKEYDSIKQAQEETGILRANISANLRSKTKSAGGHLWRYKTESCEEKITGYLRVKPVIKYSKGGKFIREYSSIKEAALDVGAKKSNISASIKKMSCVSGFMWRYKGDNETPLEIEPYKEGCIVGVIQYDMAGIEVARYDSIMSAAIVTNINRTCISACVRFKTKSAGGFIWRYKDKKW